MWDGEETAPNMPRFVHSFFSAATVSAGRAFPVFWKCSNPACSGRKDGLGKLEEEEEATVSRTRWAAWRRNSNEAREGGARTSRQQR